MSAGPAVDAIDLVKRFGQTRAVDRSRELRGNGPGPLPDAAYGLGHSTLTALPAPLPVRAFRTRSQD